MINRLLRIIPILLLLSLIGACSINIDQPSSPDEIPVTNTPQEPTAQVEAVKPRVFPTLTQIPEPSWGSIQCRDQGISIDSTDDFGFEGSIIYWDLAEQNYVILGGTPLVSRPFEIGDDYNVIGFSSSGSLLAFNEYVSNSVEIFDNHGMRWRIDPDVENLDTGLVESTNQYLVEYVTWLDDSAIFAQIYQFGDGVQHRPFPVILDIRSGEWIEDVISSVPGRSPTSVAIPSPNLQYVADSDLSIWSVMDALRLWTSPNYDYSLWASKGHGIQKLLLWSPTSNLLVYTSHDSTHQEYDQAWTRDVYLVDVLSKSEKKITNIWDYPAIVASLLAWSPDGRYLAIDGYSGSLGHDSFHLYLLIYDAYENEYAYSCQISDAEYISKFVWSPQSDSFVFYTSCNNDECQKPLRYGEFDSGKMYTLVEDIGHLGQGWSPSAPAEFAEP